MLLPFSIRNNLTKFKSASAAFSQTSPLMTGPASASGPSDPATSCNAEGAVNLTGTFQINNQQGNSAQGQANLTGTLNDQPVQYLISFTGTGDDSGNVTAWFRYDPLYPGSCNDGWGTRVPASARRP